MNILGNLHHASAWLAILAGALVLFQRKGTRNHRRWGWLYVGAMAAVNVSALSIYKLFGGFGVFHYLALFSLATMVAAVLPPMLRRPAGHWQEMHAQFMCWSYVGLLAAAVSEGMSRVAFIRESVGDAISAIGLPGTNFGFTVAFATTLVTVVGGIAIWKKLPPLLEPYRRTGQPVRQPASGASPDVKMS